MNFMWLVKIMWRYGISRTTLYVYVNQLLKLHDNCIYAIEPLKYYNLKDSAKFALANGLM